MKKLVGYVGVAVLSVMVWQAPAYAKKHHHEYSKHHHGYGNSLISDDDRATIRDYLQGHYRPKHCPPGLAKKHNGCLPPGIAKKYAMGEQLPADTHLGTLPADLLASLHQIPGYQYGQVDNDVVLVSDATQKVMDAVTLLSAVK